MGTATGEVLEALGAVRRLLEKGDVNAKAVELTLTAFRALPRPELASLVERVTLAVPTKNKRPAKTVATSQANARRMVSEEFSGRLEARERRALLAKKPDPRLARALFHTMFERDVHQGWQADEGYALLQAKLFARMRDVRFNAAFAQTLTMANAFPGSKADAAARPTYEAALAELQALEKSLPALPADVKAALAALEPLLPEAVPLPGAPASSAKFTTTTVAGVLAQVLAKPDDVEVRRVACDQLLELNDPRGEYLSLALRAHDGRLSPAEQKRLQSLFHKNAGHWAGPLAPISTREGMEFHLGFISAVNLDKSSLGLKREMWDAALESPLWGTVQKVTFQRLPDWWLLAFLKSTRVQQVRTLVFGAGDVVLERAQPGGVFHLTKCRADTSRKFVKALKAFDAAQLDALRADVAKLPRADRTIKAALSDS